MTETALPVRRAGERIRAAARDLFYRLGIRAVGIEQIVAAAGVTKPSLYRAFASKDELAAAYLQDYSRAYFERLHRVIAAHPGDPRGQIRAWMRDMAYEAKRSAYRGCGVSNAVVEYPDASHPVWVAAEENKRQLRALLTEMAQAMGAHDPQALGDGLMLLMEGAHATGQLFGPGGPASHVADAAEALIEAHLARK